MLEQIMVSPVTGSRRIAHDARGLAGDGIAEVAPEAVDRDAAPREAGWAKSRPPTISVG